MNNNLTQKTEFLLYRTEDDRIRIETRMQNETVCLSINHMAELFDADKSGISRHLKNIYESGKLQKKATAAKFATVQTEGGGNVSRKSEIFRGESPYQ